MFGRNSKVNLELNREVEKLIKTGGKEQLLPIVQAGEPVLRQQTAAYEGQLSRKTLDKLIETMRVTMIEAPGVGLAATQIGLGLALAVVEDHVRDDDDDDPREAAEFPFHVIINPSYEPIGTETRSFYEGCLSFDGYQAVRKRWLDITARWRISGAMIRFLTKPQPNSDSNCKPGGKCRCKRIMCGKGVAESNQHGIRLLRIRSLRKSVNTQQGERPTSLSLFVIPSFFRHAIVRISRAMCARIAFPTAHARM